MLNLAVKGPKICTLISCSRVSKFCLYTGLIRVFSFAYIFLGWPCSFQAAKKKKNNDMNLWEPADQQTSKPVDRHAFQNHAVTYALLSWRSNLFHVNGIDPWGCHCIISPPKIWWKRHPFKTKSIDPLGLSEDQISRHL